MSRRSRRDDETRGQVYQPTSPGRTAQAVQSPRRVDVPTRSPFVDRVIQRGIAQLDGQPRRGVVQSGPSSEIVRGMPGRAAPRASIAGRYFSERVEHPAGPVSRSSIRAEGRVQPTLHAMENRKPGEFVSKPRELNMRTPEQNGCLRENRPTDTKGSGGSRPFVPWCQKGKGKK